MSRPSTLPGLILEVARIQWRKPWVRHLTAGVAMLASALMIRTVVHRPAPAPARACTCTHAARAPHAGCVIGRPCGARRVSALLHEAELTLQPALRWSGNGFGVAWVDLASGHAVVKFRRLNAEGARLGTAIALSRAGREGVLPSVAWSGSDYGLAWTEVDADGEQVTSAFARVSAQGERRGAAVDLATGAGIDAAARAAWSGDVFGVAWYGATADGTLDVRFARFASNGNRVGEITAPARNLLPTGLLDLASDGAAFATAWTQIDPQSWAATVQMTRVDRAGRGAKPIAVGSELGGASSLVAGDDGTVGVAWEDDATSDVQHVRFVAMGADRVRGPARTISGEAAMALEPSVVWTGREYGVTWTEAPSANPVERSMYFARVSAQGERIGTPGRVVSGAFMPSLAWTGREYGLAYTTLRGSGVGVSLVRLNASGAPIGAPVEIATGP